MKNLGIQGTCSHYTAGVYWQLSMKGCYKLKNQPLENFISSAFILAQSKEMLTTDTVITVKVCFVGEDPGHFTKTSLISSRIEKIWAKIPMWKAVWNNHSYKTSLKHSSIQDESVALIKLLYSNQNQ